ncbi:class I SAM-dependent methyltransferase [Catellatospora sichuanensis]|uniref:class I SAM-dependent methyltransferase n=1 Tax=Catellatospora sichuanensis TaxID=1969805 RepID=UPI001C91D528|nr:class I SAM-dependent methyltransferase [Catellatospora sichuanensis]
MTFQQLVDAAVDTVCEGWDFGVLEGRYVQGAPSWDYREIVGQPLRSAVSLLDLGTGGGEFLSSLAPLPPVTAATEAYPPNVAVARRRLEPLGVRVADVSADPGRLPFGDGMFDLVVSRHGAYVPAEIRRVLAPGGLFVTQQVGGRDLAELNAALAAPPHTYRTWDLDTAVRELEQAGFAVADRREELVGGVLHDIGAVVLLLRLTPWQIPDFDPAGYGTQLRALHDRLAAGAVLRVHSHRFLLTARPR